MLAVRRVVGTAAFAAVLALGTVPMGPAFAAGTPSPDPSASAAASPTAATDPSASAAPSAKPSTTTDCGQLKGESTPGLDPGVVCQAGGVNPGVNPGAAPSGEPGTTTDCDPFANGSGAASPPPSGVVCIASGVRPGSAPGSGGGSGSGTLPRTGPAPLLPALALGSWLVLLGALAALAGRRRTARS